MNQRSDNLNTLETLRGYLIFALFFGGFLTAVAIAVGSEILPSVLLTVIILFTGYFPIRFRSQPVQSVYFFLIGSTIRLVSFGAVAVYALAIQAAPLSWLISPVLGYLGLMGLELYFIVLKKGSSVE